MDAFQRATSWIDLGAVRRNCERLLAVLEEGDERVAVCAVVKADAYGHGMWECARAALEGGASWLAVATASEAFELRSHFERTPILCMGALTDPELDVALGAGAEIGVWRPEFLEHVASVGAAMGRRPRVHVKYDTGMGRLGSFDRDRVLEMVEVAAREERLELAGLWTHFATADQRDSTYFDEQLESFESMVAEVHDRYPDVLVHAANSAATLREPRSHFDMVRCGIAVYGLDPFGTDPAHHGLQPVMGLSSYIAEIKRFEAGRSAGYGRSWRAERDTDVAVVPIGYGDGVRRALGNRAKVLIGGARYPVVGTVSMDNLTVNLGPGSDAEVGDEVVLLGSRGEGRILVEEWAELLETINYEVTCGIGPRVPRLNRR